MKFTIDKEKAVEALLYIVSRYGEVGRFHALKTLYFAEREHLCTYGRPITGDRMIAMENGPVPSFAYNAVKQERLTEHEKAMVSGALTLVEGTFNHPLYKAARNPDMSYFSKTDVRCLNNAFEHCVGRSFGSISDETHKHKAWLNVEVNGEMSVEDMLDGVSEDIKQEAELFASYGVL